MFANGNSRALLVGGVLLSGVLFLLALVLLTGRWRALRLVSEKTEQLSFQAMHDGLTDLPNRALVLDRAELMLARARRQDTPIATMFIDVDGFKHVNDTFGHAAGDQFLRIIADRLSSVVRETDTVGRLGGDEFVVLVEGETLSAGPELVAERLLAVLRQPFELDGALGRPQSCSVSIGVAVGQRSTADELLRDADLAHVSGQAGRQRPLRPLRGEHADRLSRPHRAGDRPRRRARQRRALSPLPADVRPPDPGRDRRRGADPLGSPDTRRGRTGRVHPAGRGERDDHPDRPLGPATSLPAGSRLARAGSHNRDGGKRVRPPTRARRVRRRGP